MTDNSVCERNTVLTTMAGKATVNKTHMALIAHLFTVCINPDSISTFTSQQ